MLVQVRNLLPPVPCVTGCGRKVRSRFVWDCCSQCTHAVRRAGMLFGCRPPMQPSPFKAITAGREHADH
jgi:hypothetical protein